MAMERFEGIVEAAKEQEIEIQALKEAMRLMEEAQVRVAERDTDIVKLRSGAPGRTFVESSYEDHSAVTRNFMAITVAKGKIVSKVLYTNPETGKKTSMTRTRDNLVDAIIARNESAATLLKEGLIDFEYFLKVTQN